MLGLIFGILYLSIYIYIISHIILYLAFLFLTYTHYKSPSSKTTLFIGNIYFITTLFSGYYRYLDLPKNANGTKIGTPPSKLHWVVIPNEIASIQTIIAIIGIVACIIYASFKIIKWFNQQDHSKKTLVYKRILIAITAVFIFTLWNTKFKHNRFEWTGRTQANRRADHSLTLLNNGNVLLSGDGPLELYNSKTKKFTYTARLKHARTKPSITELNNNKLLILGGCESFESEIYDTKTNQISLGPKTKYLHFSPSSILLNDGRVLIIGSYQKISDKNRKALNVAEIYDPKKNIFIPIKMNAFRYSGLTTKLNDGKIFVIGGTYSFDHPYEQIEIFNPTTNTFEIAIDKYNHSLESNSKCITLPNNKVLIGNKIFDPTTNYIQDTEIFYQYPYNMILLPNGKVYISCNNSSGNTEDILYDPLTNTCTKLPQKKYPKRTFEASCLLKNGTILIVGGTSIRYPKGEIVRSEIFYP